MSPLSDIDIWPEESRGHEEEYSILSCIPTAKVFPARAELFKQTINRIVAVKRNDPTRTPISDNADDSVLYKSHFSNELAAKMEVARVTVNDVHDTVCASLEALYHL